ncbi:MAG: hypothetical protein PHS98_02455 [Bacilli bacterium]|nr:hypothetical protein [Bacilli bacterium]
MYNESEFSIKGFIVKVLLVILFVFLLMWLIPMPNLKPVYDRLFTENMQTMRDAAKSYYTVDRLPKEKNETVKMTLDEMLTMKLLLPIADSDGNLCDGKASYVEIMMADNEYIVKTNLTCSNKSDYVIEHLGCYDLCPAKCIVDAPEDPKETKPVVKPVAKVRMYYLSRDWYKGYKTETTKDVTMYTHEKYGTKSVFVGYTYSCPSGYERNPEGGIMCVKYETKYDYSCEKGTLDGTKCKVPRTVYTYSCPSGYTKSGTGTDTKCSKTVSTSDWKLYGTGSGKTIPASTSTYKYISTGSDAVKDCNACASYIIYTYKIYKWTTTSTTKTATPTKTPKTVYDYVNAKATPYKAIASKMDPIMIPQYEDQKYLEDRKVTTNSSEKGYVMVKKEVIPGTTTKDYTKDWVLELSSGYTQSDKRTEYKWFDNPNKPGWKYTGKSKLFAK